MNSTTLEKVAIAILVILIAVLIYSQLPDVVNPVLNQTPTLPKVTL